MIGNPNVGKTSIFNALTGSRQHVGNWPGVTIEKKTGSCIHQDHEIVVTDLPGMYSLTARSPDEAVANDFIMNGHPDLIIQVLDSTNLERNLYLTTQLLDTGNKVVIALNMSDRFDAQGDSFDIPQFSQKWKVPVVRTSATHNEGITLLLDSIVNAFHSRDVPGPVVDLGKDLEEKVGKLTTILRGEDLDTPSLRWLSLRLMEGCEGTDIIRDEKARDRSVRALESLDPEEVGTTLIDSRYEAVRSILGETYRRGAQRRSLTDAIDRVVTNRYFGIPIFLMILWGIFQLTFVVASPFVSMIDIAFASLGGFVTDNVRPEWLASLLGDGIIGGLGFVMVFVPNILMMFLMLSMLEDSGYLARAAFLMDRTMSRIGLHGKSFIPMLLGLGCNIPAIMATRTIEDQSSRLVTILTAPFVSCAARLPVYVLFAGIFFPDQAGTVVFALYLLGIGVAIMSALIFRRTILKGEDAPFIIELPPYRRPMLKSALIHMWEKGSSYVTKAGSVILLGAVIVWAMASLPWGVEYGSEASIAGSLGHVLEPLAIPLGFDWKVVVALLFGFVAKEIVVGSLGVLYGAEEGEGLEEAIRGDMTAPAALGLMSFVLIYTPCLATLGVIWKETGSWKLTLFSVVYSLTVAYVVALVLFQVGHMMV